MSAVTSILSLLGSIVAPFILFTDQVLDIVYYCVTDFANQNLKKACLAFILINPCMIAFVLFWGILSNYSKQENQQCTTFCNSLNSAIAITLAMITKLTKILEIKIKDLRLFAAIIIQDIFQIALEDIPQLFIQGANNSLTESWTALEITSYVFSVLGIIFGIIQIYFSWKRLAEEQKINKLQQQKAKLQEKKANETIDYFKFNIQTKDLKKDLKTKIFGRWVSDREIDKNIYRDGRT